VVKNILRTTRRKLLRYSGGLLAASAMTNRVKAAIRLTGEPVDNLMRLSAGEAVAGMTSGEFTAEAYANALLKRVREKRDLNAFIALDPELVLESARAADQRRARGGRLGVLHGLPIPVKDSVFTKDYPTTAGTAALKSLHRRVDAPLVVRLKNAGAYVMGKTNLHELSTGHTSNNEIFGAVHNPFDPARIPGGSSGGTGAAVAAGMAPLGIGEDTFGSIRVPSSLCGLVGFRPTTGRYPNEEVVPLTPEFDQLGPMARGVADIILFDSVFTGAHRANAGPPLEKIRLGVPRGYFYQGMASEVITVIEDALGRLKEAGVTLVDADIPDVGNLLQKSYFPILNYKSYRTLDAFLHELGIVGGLPEVLKQAGPRMRAFYENSLAPDAPGAVTERAYRDAVQTRKHLRRVVRDYFSRHNLDAVVFPSTLCAAPPIGDDTTTEIDGKRRPIFDLLGHNMSLAPACALPALTLPAGLTRSGLPIGIEFEAAHGEDGKLLALGLSLEQALGHLPKTASG
jgi:Asp-tRNA(Asn)/Glu-tRNA(Gln) amidotransferase A subunit family amidase